MPILQSALNIPYPTRYKYDILKALDYFQSSKHAYDERMAARFGYFVGAAQVVRRLAGDRPACRPCSLQNGTGA